MKHFTLIALFIFISIQSNGQIFDRILDRTQDKLSREISNRIVERISDEIARAAMKPIDKAIDDMLAERYTQDSINGKTSSRNYGDFLAAFSVPVELPAEYKFDITLKSETKDYDGEKHNMDMMLTKDGSAIGIIQYDENDKQNMMVFDMTNNLMAIYSDDKDGKKVMAMPSMLSLAATMVAKDEEKNKYETTVKKTGKTKKILGYNTEQWEIDDETTVTKAYIAPDFPISWRESFSKFLKEMMPVTRRENMPDGMVLKSETKTKKKSKTSTFDVKEIIEDPAKIDNSQYKQTSYQTED
jgi:hypothetical protein